MSKCQFGASNACRWVPIVLWVAGLNAQTCLVLSPAAIHDDGTASLNLSLYTVRGRLPAALQWTFELPPSSISSLTIDDGPVLTAAGKTAICAENSGTYDCLAVGANRNSIENGIIARLTAVLLPGATSATLLIRNAIGVSVGGYLIPISSTFLSATGFDSSGCRIRPPRKR
jgi:hypothetical protein